MKTELSKNQGFTLLEMLLVLVIVSSILGMVLNLSTARMDQFRREKTAMQMQAVMTAASAYFVAYNAWPNIAGLQSAGYMQLLFLVVARLPQSLQH
jgi:prepilin-type N-terminal cleavage/methylation domain-containing protein